MDKHERAIPNVLIPREDLEEAARILGRALLRARSKLDATEEPAPQTQPQPRPAFLGDEVSHVEYGERYWVMSMSQVQPNIVMLEDASSDVAGYDSKSLIHLDGSPVSEIIEHRRPIPVSERLPTKEDANSKGSVLTFYVNGEVGLWPWKMVAEGNSSATAWLPCPEVG